MATEPNFRTLQFLHEGINYRALEDWIIVYYPQADPAILGRVPHTCYSAMCYRVACTALVHFPVGTRAVYQYEQIGLSPALPQFVLCVHPSEVIRREHGSYRICVLQERESLFDFFEPEIETHFVTVFSDDDFTTPLL